MNNFSLPFSWKGDVLISIQHCTSNLNNTFPFSTFLSQSIERTLKAWVLYTGLRHQNILLIFFSAFSTFALVHLLLCYFKSHYRPRKLYSLSTEHAACQFFPLVSECWICIRTCLQEAFQHHHSTLFWWMVIFTGLLMLNEPDSSCFNWMLFIWSQVCTPTPTRIPLSPCPSSPASCLWSSSLMANE